MADEVPPSTSESDSSPLGEAARRLQPKLEEAQAQLAETSERVKAFVRAHPGACVLGAVALGFVIGRLASRDA
jgi:ElaB/YqjD/DUF883 family membrane-anchored ribosome-binding protein